MASAYEKWSAQYPLHDAAQNNKEKELEIHIDKVHEYDNEMWLPLHYACFEGHSHIVKALMDAGDVSTHTAGNHFKSTPLHIAIGCGHKDVVKEILQHDRFEKNIALELKNEDGMKPLDMIKLLDDRDTAKQIEDIVKQHVDI